MEFNFKTTYNAKSMSVMSKALRKTIRKRHSKISHILGWIIFALGIVLILFSNKNFSLMLFLNILATIVIFLTLIFEDKINGYFAWKKIPPGTDLSNATFFEDYFLSTTELGESKFTYDNIIALAEEKSYFVFIYSKNHAQIYCKSSLSGGTLEEFRQFIEEKTKKNIINI